MRGARRLAVNGGDLVPGGDQRLEHRHGEIRGSHEGETHEAGG